MSLHWSILWICAIITIFNFNFNHDNLDDTKIMRFVDRMQKKNITHWKHSLGNSQFTKNPNRKTLVKLRISNHKLNIETGRYDKISSRDWICPVCGLNIEDDIHYLFDCQKCSSTRDDFSIKLIIEFLITSTCQFQL